MTATFAAVFAALYAAHVVGDHWVQTHHQAVTKGQTGWVGRLACGRHVATYTLTAAVFLIVADLRLHLDTTPGRVAAGLAVSAVTHYIADRRTPLARIAAVLGSADFWQLGACRTGRDDKPCLGTGAYALDQSWHIGWLFAAALIIA